jgi:hypothetical protein
VENVAALLRRGFDTVHGDLATLGYDTGWICLRASDIGAPTAVTGCFCWPLDPTDEVSTLPTPCARDGKGPGHDYGLPDVVERRGLLPTPTATLRIQPVPIPRRGTAAKPGEARLHPAAHPNGRGPALGGKHYRKPGDPNDGSSRQGVD